MTILPLRSPIPFLVLSLLVSCAPGEKIGLDPASPLAVRVDPPSRFTALTGGSTTPQPDSADVVLTGEGSASAAWSVTHSGRASWLTLTSDAGTGSGKFRWTSDPSGLVAGTYIDTLMVTATGADGSPARLIDTLVITPQPLTLTVTPLGRRASVPSGSTAPAPDSANVTLSGSGSGTANWSVTHSAQAVWLSLTTTGGTGSGILRWTRDPTGLPNGIYIDTITVSAAGAVGSPARVIDTLEITAAPLALVVSPASRQGSAQSGSTVVLPDSANVALTGAGSNTAAWTVTHSAQASWITLTTTGGTGSGKLRWTRNPTGLSAGTYIDTLTVTAAGASGSPARVIDTLVITAAPPPLVLALSAASRRGSAPSGSTVLLPDSVDVSLTGTGSSTATWTATHLAQASWNTLTTTGGTGSGKLRWTRNPTGLSAGTYIDTLTVTAAGASGSPAEVIDSLIITSGSQPTLSLGLVTSGVTSPLFVASPPGDPNRLFIVEQGGRIRIVKNGGLLGTPFLDISSKISTGGERGLLGLAFHPQYAQNGVFVVNYTNTSGDTRISRYVVSGNPDVANSGSEQVLLSVAQPATNHNGGMLSFGPDGYLYIALGDGGSRNNAQNRATLLGSILRVDIDGGSPYAIPPTNPYASSQTFRPEIWAYGLRNPWRFSFDRQTGHLYIADVGQSNLEEIDVQLASSSGGQNYGWDIMEGTACFSPSTGCNQTGLTLPVLEYNHSQGCSVTGGYVYRGSAIPALQGRYFYADFCQGWIRSFLYQNGQVSEQTQRLSGVGNITSFGEDALGELYVTVSSGGGAVYRIQSP